MVHLANRRKNRRKNLFQGQMSLLLQITLPFNSFSNLDSKSKKKVCCRKHNLVTPTGLIPREPDNVMQRHSKLNSPRQAVCVIEGVKEKETNSP